MSVKGGVGEERRGARKRKSFPADIDESLPLDVSQSRIARDGFDSRCLTFAVNNLQEEINVLFSGRFVNGDAHRSAIDLSKIKTATMSRLNDFVGVAYRAYHGVE